MRTVANTHVKRESTKGISASIFNVSIRVNGCSRYAPLNACSTTLEIFFYLVHFNKLLPGNAIVYWCFIEESATVNTDLATVGAGSRDLCSLHVLYIMLRAE